MFHTSLLASLKAVPSTQELERWWVQSSSAVGHDGRALTEKDIERARWYDAKLPATVLGTLVQHGVYADPFRGMGFLALPGRGPLHENFSNHAMPADSPFRVPWWFWTELELELDNGAQHWLELDGLNYRANLFVNGQLARDSTQLVGAYRAFSLHLAPYLVSGKNRLALEVFPPEPNELGLTWVDWNPSPPDKNLGLWRGARVRRTGPVRLQHPQALSRLPENGLAPAELELYATLENALDHGVTAALLATFDGQQARLEVELGPRERRELKLDSSQLDTLRVGQPRLWWPRGRGEQALYRVELAVQVEGELSDQCGFEHGIRQVTSELTSEEHALFRVNREPVLIRGGGWARDMLLRSSAERELHEYEHFKQLGLNSIRFEGMVESSRFLERCDRDGVLVIGGFCCCDHWEKWDNWRPEDYGVAEESLRSELLRLRRHPSLIAWWYGSDFPPPRHVEQLYLDVLAETRWPNPACSSAAAKPTELTGPSGMKMAGPYDYVPPRYWLEDEARGGAFGFATEISPGPAIPPLETLSEMLGPEHLWPPDECWTLHSGGGPFKDRTLFDRALEARYGAPTGAADYSWKAQLACYEAERAMFEAYARRKYRATGVIQWMLNNAWPSLIWHLWDHALRTGGGYFGVKKACEPLHIQLDDGPDSVSVVSELRSAAEVKAQVRLFDLELRERFECSRALSVPADGVVEVCQLPERASFGVTSFLLLQLESVDGEPVSRNFYWLSSDRDAVDYDKANWYMAPLERYANFRALAFLPATRVALELVGRDRDSARVRLHNSGDALAFFVCLRVRGAPESESLRSHFSDNFVSLLPGESLELTLSGPAVATAGAEVEASGRAFEPVSLPL